MINRSLAFDQHQQLPSFEIDEKKLVKTFLYKGQAQWIQLYTGFLLMEDSNDNGKIDLKIRYNQDTHLLQVKSISSSPLEISKDQISSYTLIPQKLVIAVQKPQQNLVYLKFTSKDQILAISFHSRSYCKAILEHLTLTLQNTDLDQFTWIDQNLSFLHAFTQYNLMHIDTIFTLQEQIKQFCIYFNKVDKELYLKSFKDKQSKQEQIMLQFFLIIKNMFLRANKKIIKMFISNTFYFQSILKCLSYNSFGMFHFNYLKDFQDMGVLIDSKLQLQSQNFMNEYNLIIKVKYLRDIAICTFIQLPIEAVFREIIAQGNVKIMKYLGDPETNFIQKLKQLRGNNEYNFLCVFSQIWEIFKSIPQDIQTTHIKQQFYIEWVKNEMFTETLNAISSLLKNREISQINPRFWQRFIQSMNPMLSYNWTDSQQILLKHKNQLYGNQETCLMKSLVMIFAHCDLSIKVLIFDFIRAQIQVSENRVKVTARYLHYVFEGFIKQIFQFCINQQAIEKYGQFLHKVYLAQPIRTRHFIIEADLFQKFQPYFSNKFVVIMIIKIVKAFVAVDNSDIFGYFSISSFFGPLKQKYEANKGMFNVINSMYLSMFRQMQGMKNKEGKIFLENIFFNKNQAKDIIQNQKNKQQKIQQTSLAESCKRKGPVLGFEGQMSMENIF